MPWTTSVALSVMIWLWMLDSIFSLFDWFHDPLSTWLPMGSSSRYRGTSRSGPRWTATAVSGCGAHGLPARAAGIFTVVFTFTLTMQDFIYALAFVSSSSSMTVSVAVSTVLIRGDVFYLRCRWPCLQRLPRQLQPGLHDGCGQRITA
jgi:multiple sugar transport system permease protein